MKKSTLYVLPGIVLVILFFSLIQCTNKVVQVENKIEVAASIVPIADFVRQVGGDYVNVFTIVPPNTDPHTFELAPELLIRISQTRLLVINGVGLEFWASKIESGVNKQDFDVVDTSKGIAIIAETELEHTDEHEHTSGNPHIWLDPQNAIMQVQNITNALIKVDSVHAAIYRNNAEKYINLLQETDTEFSREISSWKMHKFVCYHPAWEYFARHYGLEQAAVIQKSPGSEPGPRDIANIIETLKELEAKAIFTEVQFPGGLTKSIATESNISVITLDPIGSFVNIDNYIEMMRYNIRQMAIGLKE